MRILVTGAAGFIGSNMVDFLHERGHEVIAVDNFSTGKMDNLRGFKDIEHIQRVDIREVGILRTVFADFLPDAILHLAAQSAISTAWESPELDISVNAEGTLSLIRLALAYDVNKFVFASTAAVYGKGGYWVSKEDDKCSPDTPYGISKLAAEHYIRLMFPNHVILRFANIYGPRQEPIGDNQLITRAFRHFIHGDDFAIVGDGYQKRDFVYVTDLCEAINAALIQNVTGTFNAASGRSVSVNEVLSEIEKVYSVPGYKWAHTSEADERGSVHMNANLIRNKLGWTTHTPLSQGIRLTALDWESRA